MSTNKVDEQMRELETRWFAEHAAATAAARAIRRAEMNNQEAVAAAARTDLSRAEDCKAAIMRRIEALEESLLECAIVKG